MVDLSDLEESDTIESDWKSTWDVEKIVRDTDSGQRIGVMVHQHGTDWIKVLDQQDLQHFSSVESD